MQTTNQRRRGRKCAPLPEGFILTTNGRVSCQICNTHTSEEHQGRTLNRESIPSHTKSDTHHQALTRMMELNAAPAIREERMEFITPSATTLLEEIQHSSRTQRPSGPPEQEIEMWDAYMRVDDDFAMDEGPEQTKANQLKDFEEQFEQRRVWWDEMDIESGDTEAAMQNLQQLIDEEEQDDLLTDILRYAAQEREQNGLNIEEDVATDVDASEWFPYPSKLNFLLDTIDNLPRLRFSGSMMKVILWLLREIGVRRVPSFDGFRKMQKQVRRQNGVPTINWTSPKGSRFSFNDPRAILANDWNNPAIRPHIRRYPVIPTNGLVSEVWHGDKWTRDIDRHLLSPMYDAGPGRHFYIDEPASLVDGSVCIPVRWLEDEKGSVWADAWEIELNPDGTSSVRDNICIRIQATKLVKCMLDLECEGALPKWSAVTISAGHPLRMPNPDRKIACGDPLYTSFIDVFGDDVSGNKSKSWNKHWNIYISHRNLPRKLLNRQTNTHFLSSSPNATVPEQFEGIKSVIESTHREPVKVRDPNSNFQTRFRILCNCEPGDNPAQSEVSGHIGGNGNFPCRKCEVGGTQVVKESNDSFHSFFQPGVPRTGHDTLSKVEEQVKLACLGVAARVKEAQSSTGVKDAFTQSWIDHLIERAREESKRHPQKSSTDIQKELLEWVNERKDKIYNPFLTTKGFDAAKDTPVELLHTVLLGVVKYSWYGSHKSWSTTQQKSYCGRLQATNVCGLSIPAIRAGYIMQYANSLIGRQLKTILQVNAFHVYDLVNSLQFAFTKAIGELAALLWFPEIKDLDRYLDDVETAAANVLDIAALIDPTKIIAKIKYHLLVHLRADILRFGPLIGVATEVFESFNAIFRYCSILSNHLAPSRDIALKLADQETVKHMLAGGWWCDKSGNWMRAGPGLRNFAAKDVVLKTLINSAPMEITASPGSIKLAPEKRDTNKKLMKRVPVLWCSTESSKSVNVGMFQPNTTITWLKGQNVISRSQDTCVEGSWVFAKSPYQDDQSSVVGLVVEILQALDGKNGLVLLDQYHIASARDETFGMPVLCRRHDERTLILVPSSHILFEFNCQHDCRKAHCTTSGRRRVVQERQETEIFEDYLEHKPLCRYLINTHALHNAHLLREVVPRDLIAPLPYLLPAERQIRHNSLALGLRQAAELKRAKGAEKTTNSTPEDNSATGKSRKRRRAETDRRSDRPASGQPDTTSNSLHINTDLS